MRRLQDLEGELLIDNRMSPGLTEKQCHDLGIPFRHARSKVELPTYTCSHCHAQLVLDPKRTRERYKCTKCNKIICDGCKATQVMNGGACLPLNAFIEEMKERQAIKDITPTNPFQGLISNTRS